jgi:hypothetical protein
VAGSFDLSGRTCGRSRSRFSRKCASHCATEQSRERPSKKFQHGTDCWTHPIPLATSPSSQERMFISLNIHFTFRLAKPLARGPFAARRRAATRAYPRPRNQGYSRPKVEGESEIWTSQKSGQSLSR